MRPQYLLEIHLPLLARRKLNPLKGSSTFCPSPRTIRLTESQAPVNASLATKSW
jgi:hypothetical protein